MTIRTIWLLSLLVGFAPALSAQTGADDKVELVSGEVLFGRILRATDEEVSIQLHSGGIVSFRRRLVAEVRQGGVRSSNSSFADERVEARGASARQRSSRSTSANPTSTGAVVPTQGSSAVAHARSVPVDVVIVDVADLESRIDEIEELGEIGEIDEIDEPEPPRQLEHAEEPLPRIAAETKKETSIEPAREPPVAATAPEIGPERGFRMSMPSGFVRSTGLDFGELPADEGILESLHDPETQASLLVSALRTREDIVSIKNTILKDALARFEAVRVERDAEWNHQAARGWKVELRGELGGISLKQIHLFVRAGERVLIATFTCADALWPRYESELSASLRSLRAADRPIAEPTPPRASVSVPELPAG